MTNEVKATEAESFFIHLIFYIARGTADAKNQAIPVIYRFVFLF